MNSDDPLGLNTVPAFEALRILRNVFKHVFTESMIRKTAFEREKFVRNNGIEMYFQAREAESANVSLLVDLICTNSLSHPETAFLLANEPPFLLVLLRDRFAYASEYLTKCGQQYVKFRAHQEGCESRYLLVELWEDRQRQGDWK